MSDTKVNIYYYKAGDVAAMYTFEVPSIKTIRQLKQYQTLYIIRLIIRFM